MKTLWMLFSILLAIGCSRDKIYSQTPHEIDQKISMVIQSLDTISDRWEGDSILPDRLGDLFNYLEQTLPKTPRSLQYNYKFERGVVYCTTSEDKKFRIWTFCIGLDEAGNFMTLAEFATESGPKVKDLSDTTRFEGNVGSGGSCDTIYSISSKNGATYYMPLMRYSADRNTGRMGIDTYSIQGDTLRSNIKLFRTPKKELSSISFWCDFFKGGDEKIHLGHDGKSLFIPLVKDDSITTSNLRYDFDGKQFVYKGIEK